MKALEIKFEVSKEQPYNPYFVEKIVQGDKDFNDGKSKKITLEELNQLCKLSSSRKLKKIWTIGLKPKTILRKISHLTISILETPYHGVGKPEALKYQLPGKWSRRITNEHRYVYSIENDTIKVYSLKGDY